MSSVFNSFKAEHSKTKHIFNDSVLYLISKSEKTLSRTYFLGVYYKLENSTSKQI